MLAQTRPNAHQLRNSGEGIQGNEGGTRVGELAFRTPAVAELVAPPPATVELGRQQVLEGHREPGIAPAAQMGERAGGVGGLAGVDGPGRSEPESTVLAPSTPDQLACLDQDRLSWVDTEFHEQPCSTQGRERPSLGQSPVRRGPQIIALIVPTSHDGLHVSRPLPRQHHEPSIVSPPPPHGTHPHGWPSPVTLDGWRQSRVPKPKGCPRAPCGKVVLSARLGDDSRERKPPNQTQQSLTRPDAHTSRPPRQPPTGNHTWPSNSAPSRRGEYVGNRPPRGEPTPHP